MWINWLTRRVSQPLRADLQSVCLAATSPLGFGYSQITVRDGKGAKDRVTMLPEGVTETLKRHMERRKLEHQQDIRDGGGGVYLPFALARKYPNAAKAWAWQYVFAAK